MPQLVEEVVGGTKYDDVEEVKVRAAAEIFLHIY
jgi:hypothetical protein